MKNCIALSLVALILAVGLASAPASADTIALNPSDWQQTQFYYYTGEYQQSTKRINNSPTSIQDYAYDSDLFLKYDLSALPGDIVIDSVTLSATCYWSATTTATPLLIYRSDDDTWTGSDWYDPYPGLDGLLADNITGFTYQSRYTFTLDGSGFDWSQDLADDLLTVALTPPSDQRTGNYTTWWYTEDAVLTLEYSQAVPEPATLSLVALGALGVALLRRRRG